MTFSRRQVLQHSGSVLVAVSFAGQATAASAKEKITPSDRLEASERLGGWYTTRGGLPAYDYRGALPAGARDRTGADAREAPDPTFILGNNRITAFAHVSGQVQILTGERAWARVNAADNMNYADNTGKLTVDGQDYNLIGLTSLAADPKRTKRRFGPGFACYDYSLAPKMSCRRVLSVKPSTDVNTGNPTLIATIRLTNSGATPLAFTYEEGFRNHYVLAGQQRLTPEKRAARYESKVTADAERDIALSTTRYVPNMFAVETSPENANSQDIKPTNVFIHARVEGEAATADITTSTDKALSAQVRGVIPARKSITLHIIIGLTYGGLKEAQAQIADVLTGTNVKTLDEGLFTDAWKARLPDVSKEKNPIFKLEMPWHAYTLEAMATYTAYFDETFVPQGVIYAYEDGENISNRDNLQALLPLCYTHPALAKSCLRHVFKQTTTIGEIKRGTGGFGYVSPSIYKESDEQLYMFMALAEYLRITRDYAILDETITYYPAELKTSDSVLNVLKKHFIYLRDEVGFGPNGLIKILNSDWSDSFFHDYSPNNTAHAAESHVNSAMALAVLPVLIQGLKAAGRPATQGLIDAMTEFNTLLSKAYFIDLGDRDFSARAYLPDNKPKFGLDIVCIEPQGFLLLTPSLPIARKRAIYKKVKSATFDTEKVGFRVHERPIFGGKGEAEDGAIWFALEYQMVWGVITFDKPEARRLLEAMSFHNYARQYPDYWMGRWTHFDSVQSSLSDREGLLNYWRRTFNDCTYGYCSHPHSWPLYNYLRLTEA